MYSKSGYVELPKNCISRMKYEIPKEINKKGKSYLSYTYTMAKQKNGPSTTNVMKQGRERNGIR